MLFVGVGYTILYKEHGNAELNTIGLLISGSCGHFGHS